MNKLWLILRTLHFVYLGMLLAFIIFYFTEYRSYRIESTCAETSAKQVLGANPDQDANGLYKKLFQDCVSR